MQPFGRHRRFEVPRLRSLSFGVGDAVVDWLGGQHVALSDGTATRFGTGRTYRLDRATGLDAVGVIYEQLGTKALLVRDNGVRPPHANFIPMGVEIVRELNRSFYCAEAYAYPVTVFDLPDGRRAVAHCPRAYNRLDIELLDGTLLTPREGEDDDVFHSRLQASPDGRWLLSNGWVWHPWNVAQVFDVAKALVDPTHLAGEGLVLTWGDDWAWEVEAATLVGDRLVIATSLEAAAISVVPLEGGAPQVHRLTEPPGTTLVPWGPDHVVAAEGQPRLIELATGEIVGRLDALNGGKGWYQPNGTPPEPPWIAVDPRGGRFAIAAPAPEGDGWLLDVVTRE